MAHPLLEALAQAYFRKHRRRLGITEEDRADRAEQVQMQAAGTNDVLKQAQLARIIQEMGLAPVAAEQRARLVDAQIRNYDEPNRAPAHAGTPHYETDAAGNVTALIPQPDGTFVTQSLGKIGTPQRPPAGSSGDGGIVFAANPFSMSEEQPDGSIRIRQYVRVKGGGIVPVDQVGGRPVGPAPTAEMRNTEYQGAAVEDAFTLVNQSLDNFEAASAGGLPGAPSAIVPGTDAYYAKSRFVDQAKALLGAITARQSGEGSRLSDEDRVAYSQASTLVNSALLLPGGVEEARGRIAQAERLIKSVQKKRQRVGAGGMPPTGDDVVSDLPGGGWDQAAASASAPAAGAVEFVRDPATGRLVRKR